MIRFRCSANAQFFPARQIFVVATKICLDFSGAGKNWAFAEQRSRIKIGVPPSVPRERGRGFVTRRVTNPLRCFCHPEKLGALLQNSVQNSPKSLLSILPPEKVVQQVPLAEMKDSAPHPVGSRAPRAPLVGRETQGTLSPLSSDGENGTRFPLEPFAFGGDSPENSAHFRKTRRNIT